MRIEFTQAARRHKVGQARVRYVIAHPFVVDRVPAPEGSPVTDDRIVFLGDDETGRALEVMAVEIEGDGLLVIHAMDLRNKYRDLYEEWRPQ